MNKVVKDIAEARVPLNYAQFILILFFTISATFTLTKIYDRFEAVEEGQQDLKELILKVDERVTKITKRNTEAIKQLKK